ncbi:MAG: barstar family protein [Clostridia bacterium]|nr:barstar family protein [Clostridia bacterium]
MKNIIIDFSKCKYPLDLHNEIKEKLNLPEWYGNNLDGLWDMLTGFIETPINITVVFKPETKAVENLKENVLKIIETFKEAAEEDEEIEFNCEF